MVAKARSRRVGPRDPAWGVLVILVGCALSFYLVGLALIPVGVWLLPRGSVDVRAKRPSARPGPPGNIR